ncbi:PTS transporter subunit EIIC [Clostridium brassicae]|uniref:PTS transporter subunit EIIC n=1 Tax=Clostridium brassicae TaxID=2999072 RepID=A0ABT4DF52_9CLOT|nr:PTS transporter subunit EIIC [Clostridium brassicae]MCY6959826.1 PTS transporter subunit EIIC [Clostridium brassicae]
MSNNSNVSSKFQGLGKMILAPIAVLLIAALLFILGKPNTLASNGIPWISAASSAVFENLSLIIAIAISIGIAEENNGVAGLSATVGHLVITKVALSFNEKINMFILPGIIVGILAGLLYNKYKAIKVPDFLGFFGGKRFVPIITSLICLILGILFGFIWPPIQNLVMNFGNMAASVSTIGVFF